MNDATAAVLILSTLGVLYLECPNVNSITLFSSVIELTLRNVNNSRNFHNTCLTLRSGNNTQLTLSLCNNT